MYIVLCLVHQTQQRLTGPPPVPCHRVLQPDAWVQALIRLAAMRYNVVGAPSPVKRKRGKRGAHVRSARASTPSGSGLTLCQAVVMLLEDHILPYAYRTNAGEFRRSVDTPMVHPIVVCVRVCVLIRRHLHPCADSFRVCEASA